MVRRVQATLVAVVCAAITIAFAPVAGAQYPPASDAECVRTLNLRRVPTSVFSPGEEFIIQGRAIGNRDCADGGARVTFLFSCDINIGSATANSAGNYEGRARIPSGASSGAATVCARTSGVTYTRSITVRGVGVAGKFAVLPKTGGDLALLAAWGGALLLIGTALTLATWRRWRRARAERAMVRAGLGGPAPLSDEDWLASWDQGARPGAELVGAGVAVPEPSSDTTPARPVTEADILGL